MSSCWLRWSGTTCWNRSRYIFRISTSCRFGSFSHFRWLPWLGMRRGLVSRFESRFEKFRRRLQSISWRIWHWRFCQLRIRRIRWWTDLDCPWKERWNKSKYSDDLKTVVCVTRPFCLVESHIVKTLPKAGVLCFTSYTFCNNNSSCSLRLNENRVSCYDQPT